MPTWQLEILPFRIGANLIGKLCQRLGGCPPQAYVNEVRDRGPNAGHGGFLFHRRERVVDRPPVDANRVVWTGAPRCGLPFAFHSTAGYSLPDKFRFRRVTLGDWQPCD
jgi:hypothetical protein